MRQDNGRVNGRFAVGWEGGPGRPLGSRNKLTTEHFDEMYAAFKRRGVEAIERTIDEHPEVFIAAIGKIIPRELLVKVRSVEEEDGDALRDILDEIRARKALLIGEIREANGGADSEGRDPEEPGEQSP